MLVGANPAFKDAAGALIGGNNMAAVHLADAVGGNLFLGFISAVAFATILPWLPGLRLPVHLRCRMTCTRTCSAKAQPSVKSSKSPKSPY